MEEHGDALDYDLLTRTRYQLNDIPDNLGWTALAHFIKYLGPGSALYDEVHPETARWTQGDMILADIFDAVSAFRYAFASANSKGKPRRPKPYPRPWVRERETKRFGKDPVKVSEFNSWWESST